MIPFLLRANYTPALSAIRSGAHVKGGAIGTAALFMNPREIAPSLSGSNFVAGRASASAMCETIHP